MALKICLFTYEYTDLTEIEYFGEKQMLNLHLDSIIAFP